MRRIGYPVGIAIAILTGLLLWRIAVLDFASQAEDRADQTLVAAAVLRTNLLRAQNEERGFLLTGSRAVVADDVTRREIPAQIAELRAAISEPDQLQLLAKLQRNYEAWRRTADLLAARRSAGDARPVYTLDDLAMMQSEAANDAAAMLLAQRREVRERKSDANDLQVRVVIALTIAGSVFLCGLFVFVAWNLLIAEAERRRRDVELAEQNARMRESARVKSEFVAHMSHEFRTPLTAILALGEMLYDEKAGPLNAAQKSYLADVLTSGRHLLGLINQVLDVAKVEAGKIGMTYVQCDPRRVASEAIATLRPLARERAVNLRVDFTAAPANVVTDCGRLKQVLYNYLSNALSFTPPGGSVTVRISAQPHDRVRLEVRDTGCGIAPEDMPKLFRDFSQVQSANGAARDGAGLGLALTKRIVEAQGGRVWAESRLGAGSAFFAEFPRDPRRPHEEPGALAAAG